MSKNVALVDVTGEQIFPITTSENVFTEEGITLKETLENIAGGGSAVVIDTAMSETSENPVQNKVISAKLNEVFQSVSNGKSLIASAITDKGIATDANDTFETMANNIDSISGGGSNLNNVLSVILSGTTKIRFGSKIELATSITSSLLTASFSFDSITRVNNNTFELTGDFSSVSSFTIETLSGFFYDDSILSTNEFETKLGILEFTTSGESICTLDGRTYVKTNDGLAIGGYHYRGNNTSELYPGNAYSNPLLISETENACHYKASSGSFSTTDTTSFVYDKDGKTYYCSLGGIAMGGNLYSTGGRGVKLDDIPEIVSAVENGRDFVFAVLDYYYGYI